MHPSAHSPVLRTPVMRRLPAVLGAIGLVLALAAAAVAQETSIPEVIPLPQGFQPEGIVIAPDGTAYAGSLADGTVVEADLATGTVSTLYDADGSPAVGLTLDAARNRLYVAGGGTGTVEAVDTTTGDLVDRAQLLEQDAGFVNDLVIAGGTLWATNSFGDALHAITLADDGFGAVEQVPLGEDFDFQQDGFNANGIAATADGSTLLIVQSATGTLYTVDPDTGVADAVDLQGSTSSLPNGDGILLDGRLLYVVQNRLDRVALVWLGEDLSAGRVIGSLTDADYRVPTTIDLHEGRLFAVNARFGIDNPSEAAFEIVATRVGF